ncbi:MAG: ABC transporter permease [Arcobacteraceae bacterium]|nr:ABC transporter permease [Arcobacteraceae bacterium]MDY0365504.1 ABC transporter permease [Arcobacteraceae bacterium]
MKNILVNILYLIKKELQVISRDIVIIVMIFYSFSFAIYVGAKASSSELSNAPIAFIDEDKSILSQRIIDAFYEPRFTKAKLIDYYELDRGMDKGLYTFVVVIPSNFEKDIQKSNPTQIQLNIDATRMSEAGIGASYISQIIQEEVYGFIQYFPTTPIEQVISYKYNPNLTSYWSGSINKIIDNIMTFSILLAAAMLMREKEHGTLEHLLVMPIGTFEIMISKIISSMFIILLGVIFALFIVVKILFAIPIAGSLTLFFFATLLVLFATTSLGIFIGTLARTMPQLGMMFVLLILPLMMLSGGVTPYESMPEILQIIMKFSPTTHFVEVSQGILFRDVGIEIIWKNLLSIFIIGVVFFTFALLTLKKSLEAMR